MEDIGSDIKMSAGPLASETKLQSVGRKFQSEIPGN